MNGEQEGGNISRVRPDIVPADFVEEQRDDDVENEVEQVIAERIEAVDDPTVPGEGP